MAIVLHVIHIPRGRLALDSHLDRAVPLPPPVVQFVKAGHARLNATTLGARSFEATTGSSSISLSSHEQPSLCCPLVFRRARSSDCWPCFNRSSKGTHLRRKKVGGAHMSQPMSHAWCSRSRSCFEFARALASVKRLPRNTRC